MFHIYVHTPLYKKSNYLAHLVEHVILNNMMSKHWFSTKMDFNGYTYAYYTYFEIFSDSRDDLNKLLEIFKKPLDISCILYEKKVLIDELKRKDYSKYLVEKIGKTYYLKDFKYLGTGKINKQELIDYYEKYYINWNIIVLEDQKNYKDLLEKDNFYFWGYNLIKNMKKKELVFTCPYTPRNIFIIDTLVDFFNNYLILKQRYKLGEYYFDDLMAWEFDDFVFLSIQKTYLKYALEIEPKFISDYIDYKVNNLDKNDYKYEYYHIDWPLFFKFWYGISKKSKIEMIKNIWKYYETFQIFARIKKL